MINQFILVGAIKEMPLENEKFKLEVKRNYKNMSGEFENDVFDCYIWLAISKRIMLSCKMGDVVAVKGRLVGEDGKCNIIAEQIVLLNKVA